MVFDESNKKLNEEIEAWQAFIKQFQRALSDDAFDIWFSKLEEWVEAKCRQ